MEKGNDVTTSGPQVATASSSASGGSTQGSTSGPDVNQGAVAGQPGGGGRFATSTQERDLASGSITDEHGVTTTASDAPDGRRWVTKEGEMGGPADRWGDYASSGSTNADGTKTEVSRDADGKVVRTTMDADGGWVQSEHFDADGNLEWINTPEGGYQRPG